MDSFLAQDRKTAINRTLVLLGTLSNLLSSTLPRYLVFDIEQCISGFGMNLKRYQTPWRRLQ